MEMPDDADAQTLDALMQIGGEIGDRAIGAGRVERIVSGHAL